MESRWGRLIVHAFRTGALDFSQYSQGDAYWELREELVLEDIHMAFDAKVSELSLLWHSCAGQPTGWEEDEERANYHFKEADKTWKDVGRCLLPWYDLFKKRELSAQQLWEVFKEQEKDPAYAAYLKSERQRLRTMARRAVEGVEAEKDAVAALRELRRRFREKR